MEGLFYEIQSAAAVIASPNWADILSVLLSFAAIIVAGFVAWRQNKISKQQANISEQQNKIAVFEKRYAVYDALSKCILFDEFLDTLFDGKNISIDKVHLLFTIAVKEPSIDIKNMNVFQEVTNIRSKLDQAEFLFSKNVSDHLSGLAESLLKLILADAHANQSKTISELREEYSQITKEITTDGILQEIKDSLNLATTK